MAEITGGFTSETIRVDIPGSSGQGRPIWVLTNHGAVGPGATDNAGGAAGAALLARQLMDNPPPVPVSIIWTAGGDAQYCGGLACYLENHTPPDLVLAICRLGSDQPAVFGDRIDTLFGKARNWPAAAPDLKPEDYIPLSTCRPCTPPCFSTLIIPAPASCLALR